MNVQDARSLGRYCEKHRKVHRRIRTENGAATTMCPDCAADPEFQEAMNALVSAAWKWYKQGKQAPPDDPRAG